MTDRLERIKQIHAENGIINEEIDWLIAEVERLRPDAERWRYVREHGAFRMGLVVDDGFDNVRGIGGVEAERNVDAAIVQIKARAAVDKARVAK